MALDDYLYDEPEERDVDPSSAFEPLGFLDLADQDEYENPYALGTLPRTKFKHIDPEVARRVLAETGTEGPSFTGFGRNVYSDIREQAGDIQTLLGMGLRELPYIPRDLANAALHPIETGEKVLGLAGDIASGLKEEYTPREGEGVLGMLGRRAYEKPFTSLMDLSAVLQGPAGIARLGKKAGLVGAVPEVLETAAQFGREMDPISLATKAIKPLAISKTPDATSRFLAARAGADATADLKAEWRYLDKQFNYALHDPERGVFAGLNQAEKNLLFAYGEGRFQLLDTAAQPQIPSRAALITEPLRKEAMDAALQKYSVLQEEWDRVRGKLPEQVAEQRLKTATRQLQQKGLDPELPENRSWLEANAMQAAQEAEEQYALRRTVSMRTVLDEAKEASWTRKLEQEVIEGRAADIEEASRMIPRPAKATPAEAMELMGPDGGVIFHHSMEVLTREQATVGNTLQKMKEASFWKDNEGELFKQGLLDTYDVERAMWAVHHQVSRGATLPRVAESIIEALKPHGLAVELPKGYKRIADPELTGGTHQLISPGYMHLEDLLRGQYNKFITKVLEVGEDAAVAELNIPELTEHFLQGQSKMFKLRPEYAGKVYKVPMGAADSLAAYERSLRPNPSVFSRVSSKLLSPWHFTNLRLFGTKISNDAIGNGVFGAIQGVHPFSLDGIDALVTAGKAMRGRYEGASEKARQLAKVYDLPGVAQGAANVLMEGEYGISAGSRGWFHEWLANSPDPIRRGIATWGDWAGRLNEHIDDYWRAASMIYELKKTAPEAMKGMAFSAKAMETFSNYLDELSAEGAGALRRADYDKARKAMDHYFPNYDRATATDRIALSHFMPYHKFYKHAANVLLKAPFEKPLKSRLAFELGQRAQQDVKDTLESWGFNWNTMVREDLRTGVPIDVSYGPDGSPSVMMLNSQGPNPFSFISGGDLGEAGIGAINPYVKLAFEQALGVNLFTLRKYLGAYSEAAGKTVDQNGEIVERKEAPPLIEHFLRQFRVYNTMRDMVARGRVPTDTATLLDMIEGTNGAWEVDDRGFAQRKPLPYGPLTPLIRTVGLTPQVLQAPTKRQIQGRRAQMATLFNDVFQRHPEYQQTMLELVQKHAEEIMREEPPVPIQPRLF